MPRKTKTDRKPEFYTFRLIESQTLEHDLVLPGIPRGNLGAYTRSKEIRIKRTVIDTLVEGIKKDGGEVLKDSIPWIMEVIQSYVASRMGPVSAAGSTAGTAVGDLFNKGAGNPAVADFMNRVRGEASSTANVPADPGVDPSVR